MTKWTRTAAPFAAVTATLAAIFAAMTWGPTTYVLVVLVLIGKATLVIGSGLLVERAMARRMEEEADQ